MTPRAKWILGLTLTGVAVAGAAVAIASNAQAASPTPTPAPTPGQPASCPAPGAVTGRPAMQLSVDYSKTGTTLSAFVSDSVRVALLQQPTGNNWTLGVSDDSVLDIVQSTTGPDASAAGGTDSVFLVNCKGSGVADITGTSQSGQTFKVTVTVCNG